MIVRSRAPLRISFGGGGTDVPPYPQERGGAVISATIDKYTYASLIPTDRPGLEVESLDYDVIAKYENDADLRSSDELDAVKAVLREFSPSGLQGGLRLFLHSDAPPGSGLGSSSAMVVALIGLFRQYQKLPLTNYEVARLACQIERERLGIPGGLQDQYAATFGGFNFIEFQGGTVVVNPLRMEREILNELEYHLLLCYTGRTRRSANILRDQIQRYTQKVPDMLEALDATKRLAIEIKNSLLRGDLDGFGRLLDEGWRQKKRFSAHVSDELIDGMYEAALRHGALGGKILGAGGGGYLLLYCPFDRKHLIAAELERRGGKVVEFGFESRGLQTWMVA